MSTRYTLENEGSDKVVYEYDSISGTKKIAVIKDRFFGPEVTWVRDGYEFEIENGAGPIKATINGSSGYFNGEDFVYDEEEDEDPEEYNSNDIDYNKKPVNRMHVDRYVDLEPEDVEFETFSLLGISGAMVLFAATFGLGAMLYTYNNDNNQIKQDKTIESVINSPNAVHYKRDANGSLELTNPKLIKKDLGKYQIYYKIGPDGSLIISDVPLDKKPQKKEITYYAYTDVKGKTYLLDRPYIGNGMASITVPDPSPDRYGMIETFSVGKEAVERKMDDNKLYCWEEQVGDRKFIRLEKQPEGLEAKLFNGKKDNCKD